jgi:hypothetical protein
MFCKKEKAKMQNMQFTATEVLISLRNGTGLHMAFLWVKILGQTVPTGTSVCPGIHIRL